jgi:hypothetical protein
VPENYPVTWLFAAGVCDNPLSGDFRYGGLLPLYGGFNNFVAALERSDNVAVKRPLEARSDLIAATMIRKFL